MHPGVLPAAEVLHLRNDVVQSEGFAHRLCARSFGVDVHDVDVEVVVSRLIVNVEFQHVRLGVWEEGRRGSDESAAEVTKPRALRFLQITDRPDVSTLHEGQEVQRRQSLTVPVQIRQKKEVILRFGLLGAVKDILLLSFAVEDIENPIKAALFPAELHVRAYVRAVDRGRLDYDTGLLEGVLADVLLGARVNEIYFEVCGRRLIDRVLGHAVGEVPAVDIIFA